MTFIEECECSLIGDILLKPEIFAECVSVLSPESFSLVKARRVFKECMKLFNEGKETDPLTVISVMGKDKDEYKKFLLGCRKMSVSTENYHALIDEIHKEEIRRKTLSFCSSVADGINNMEIEDVREKVSSLLSSFDSKKYTSEESLSTMYSGFMKYLGSADTFVKTGIKKVDDAVTIDKGDFVIIGGRPSSGKTALALQLAMNISKTHKVAFFSLETSSVKVFTRMLSSATETDIRTLRNRELISRNDEYTASLWKKINDFTISAGKEMDFTFVQAAGWSASQIRSKAVQMGAEVIFIDYLTLIMSKAKTPYEKATEISMSLHTLAQSEGITVFALAQLNRQSEHQDVPSMADLRESGQIEQDADSIFLLSAKRVEDTPVFARRTLHIVKNKDGDTGEIDLIFNGTYQKFGEEEE